MKIFRALPKILVVTFASLSWAESISLPPLLWSGDMRYRVARRKEAMDDERKLQQLRVRLGVKAEINDDTTAVMRLATATSAVSGNQVLGDKDDPGMPRRYFGLDHGYIDHRPTEWAQIWAGRTANPYFSPGKSQLLFDSDLAFEGVALRFKKAGAFANLTGYVISENYSAPTDLVDQGLVAAEVGYGRSLEAGSFTVRMAHFNFPNVQDVPITRFDKNARTDSYSTPSLSYRGNTVVQDGTSYLLTHRFELWQVGAEWRGQALDSKLEYTFWFDGIRNQKGGDLNTAYEYGVNCKYSRYTLGYAFMSRKANSMLGAFTDDDFNFGGTDNKGSRFSLAIALAKNTNLGVNHFVARRGVDTTEREYNGTMADVSVSF